MNLRHPTVLAAAVLLLAQTGCTNSTPPPADGSPTTSSASTASPAVSSTPAATPSPTSTLTTTEQQAFDEATDAVMAYRQTWVDLYTGARTNLNDLHTVLAGGELLDASLRTIQQDLNSGVSSTPKGAQIALVSAEPVTMKLKKDPPTVVIRACIDATSVMTKLSADDPPHEGVREEATYTVIKTSYLPLPGWAVLEMTGPADPENRRC